MIETTFWTCKKFFLEIKCKVTQTDGTDLRYDATSAAISDNPIFFNNTLQSLFSECTVTANGINISNSNGINAHKAFIETEYSNGKEAKDTSLRCQGYTYEANPGDGTATVFASRADIFSCDKQLLSGVTLRIFFVRSKPEFALIYDTDA